MNEWTNTKMIFEIIPKGEKLLNFTHEGLFLKKSVMKCVRMAEMDP